MPTGEPERSAASNVLVGDTDCDLAPNNGNLLEVKSHESSWSLSGTAIGELV
jgi:hypothetical protein